MTPPPPFLLTCSYILSELYAINKLQPISSSSSSTMTSIDSCCSRSASPFFFDAIGRIRPLIHRNEQDDSMPQDGLTMLGAVYSPRFWGRKENRKKKSLGKTSANDDHTIRQTSRWSRARVTDR